MRLVVADTSPIFYLRSVGQIALLPRLFAKVFVPDAVHKELCHPAAPPVLQEWMMERPSWLEAMPVDLTDDDALQPVGAGERAAIALALSMHADLILVDGTFGAGGYSRAFLDAGAQVVAFDRDPTVSHFAAPLEASGRLRLIAAPFSAMTQILGEGAVDGVALDLGV